MKCGIRLTLLFCSLVALVPGVVSCKDDFEESKLFSLIQTTSWTAQPGEKVLFSVYACSTGADLDRLEFNSYDKDSGMKPVDSVELFGKEQRIILEYQVPRTTRDTLQQILFFRLSNAAGEVQESSYYFLIVPGEKKLLEEHGSFTIYSNLSGKTDALSLGRLAVLSSSADSTAADIVLHTADRESDTPVFSVSSLTDLVFVKSESYDYPNATEYSLCSVFEGSVCQSEASNLKADDIVLMGRRQSSVIPVAAMKVQAVFDEPGVENDRMLVSIKYIQQ